MKNPKLKNLIELVNHDFCIGCGLCQYIINPTFSNMKWTKNGFLIPDLNFNQDDSMLRAAEICPFSNGLVDGIQILNEDELADIIFNSTTTNHDNFIGHYKNIYAGYAVDFRLTGSSGGITTWILVHLLKLDYIDHAICVSPTNQVFPLFEYRICSTKEEIIECSKSKYYPIHLANILKFVAENNGRYAIVTLPCMTKGLRLLQQRDPIIRERIVFIIGLFCGGLKSSFFTEYLAAHININRHKIKNPEYRVKIRSQNSRNYEF